MFGSFPFLDLLKFKSGASFTAGKAVEEGSHRSGGSLVTVFLKPLGAEVQALAPVMAPVQAVIGFVQAEIPRPNDLVNIRYTKHAAITAYGNFYEYTEDGLFSLEDSEEIEEVLKIYDEKIQAGYTAKTLDEFHDWLCTSTVKNELQPCTYDLATNNCIHFVRDVCLFLGVEVPARISEIIDWLSRRSVRGFVGLVGFFSGSSRSSSKSSKTS